MQTEQTGLPTPRLALFAGSRYYPRKGARDFRAFAATQQELEELFAAQIDHWLREEGGGTRARWGQIVDAATMVVLAEKSDDETWHAPGDARFLYDT